MRRKTIMVAALAMAMTALVGCGGGGGEDDSSDEPLSRTMIAGDGDALGGSRFTTKKWKILAMKANGNYTPAGADLPCPATATLKADSGTTIECRANSFVEFRSDGKSRQYDETSAATEPFDDSWDFSADVLNVTTRDGGSTDFGNYSALNEGVIGGKQRIRIRTITHTLDGEAQPEDVGNEILLEDAS